MATKNKRTSTLGQIRAQRDHYRAQYMRDGVMHTPGRTFHTFALADQWLAAEQLLIARDEWTPPAERRAAAEVQEVRDARTVGEFAAEWIGTRTTSKGRPLAPKTRHEYQAHLNGRLADLAARPLVSITRDDLDRWWQDNADAPSSRHGAYAMLKSVMKDAVDRGLIAENPCKVANASRRARKVPKQVRSSLVVALTPGDVDALAAAMDRERFRLLVLLVAYCGLRPGEALALTRRDVIRATRDGLPRYELAITKAISDDGKARAVGPTKTDESVRVVLLPPHLAPVLDAHESEHAAPGEDGLLFPSTNPHKAYATIQQVMGTAGSEGRSDTLRDGRKRVRVRTATGFHAARESIGRPTLRLYDLRHWARTTWTRTGLDTSSMEMMLGHVLPDVMGAYSHLDLEHLWPYAVRVSELAGWRNPTTTKPAPPTLAPTGDNAPAEALASVLSALDDHQLADALASLPDAQRAAVLGALDPARVVAVIGALAGGRPALRVVDGGRDA